MANIEKLVEDLSSLTIIEAAELSKVLEEKWGVSASAVSVAPISTESKVEEVAEKTEFDVTLISFGAKKLEVIKVVKAVLSIGLKEAKELIEKAPVVLKSAVSNDVAQELKSKLEEAGAQVELK
ncbi:50S ribosomal protein L7/L12 [Rickettsia endosymbiont of Cardiosporidium cionae]|uniref:50S ribosomal protein L7/L12 n=1 Tax=Rickettsia endosymbiont of Cardiosporidium cionae TaxID=2777155 RepID=UPI00189580A1|nr:50S ribosomal protein L7/L12 [Rickettsia endosymbiont of Cardiosporidium cionae]KAF8818630.1 50S ribosomal protein L7/L12 [Rickettsia endosymbiont of Cardiosporidium cionae]